MFAAEVGAVTIEITWLTVVKVSAQIAVVLATLSALFPKDPTTRKRKWELSSSGRKDLITALTAFAVLIGTEAKSLSDAARQRKESSGMKIELENLGKSANEQLGAQRKTIEALKQSRLAGLPLLGVELEWQMSPDDRAAFIADCRDAIGLSPVRQLDNPKIKQLFADYTSKGWDIWGDIDFDQDSLKRKQYRVDPGTDLAVRLQYRVAHALALHSSRPGSVIRFEHGLPVGSWLSLSASRLTLVLPVQGVGLDFVDQSDIWVMMSAFSSSDARSLPRNLRLSSLCRETKVAFDHVIPLRWQPAGFRSYISGPHKISAFIYPEYIGETEAPRKDAFSKQLAARQAKCGIWPMYGISPMHSIK